MRILITGATGLIGTRLRTRLLAENYEINYLTTQTDFQDSPGSKGFYWNPEMGKIDENCMLGIDVIVHLAGASISKRWTQSYKQEIIESRILSANLLYKTLRSNPHNVRQIVSASAIGIYPNSLTQVFSENEALVDNSFLGDVVANWEQSVDKFKQLGLKVCKLRTGLVLSRDGGVLNELVKPARMGMGSALGSGMQSQSWIHIEDMAEMYAFAIKNELDGIYNAVAPNPVTNKTLTQKISAVLSKPYFMPNVPTAALKLTLGEMHYLLVASQNVSAFKILSEGFEFKFAHLDEALLDLLK